MTDIQVHEEVFDGYPWRPTKPLTVHQMAIGDLMANGCRPQFVKAIYDWLKAGRTTIVLLHPETPAEATILALLVERLELEQKTGKGKVLITNAEVHHGAAEG